MRIEKERKVKEELPIRDSNLPLKKNLNYNYRFHFLIILGSVSSKLKIFKFIEIMRTIKIRLNSYKKRFHTSDRYLGRCLEDRKGDGAKFNQDINYIMFLGKLMVF